MNANVDSSCVRFREAPAPSLMLDVRTDKGDHWAFPYSFLIFARYDKDAISLRFSSHSVRIAGRSLDRIYEGILLQRVESIAAQDARYDVGPEGEPFVSVVEVVARE